MLCQLDGWQVLLLDCILISAFFRSTRLFTLRGFHEGAILITLLNRRLPEAQDSTTDIVGSEWTQTARTLDQPGPYYSPVMLVCF